MFWTSVDSTLAREKEYEAETRKQLLGRVLAFGEQYEEVAIETLSLQCWSV
jgi:hypothetical protein